MMECSSTSVRKRSLKSAFSIIDNSETDDEVGRKKMCRKVFAAADEAQKTNDNTPTMVIDTTASSNKNKNLPDSLPATPDDSGYATTSGLQPGSNSYISDSECGLYPTSPLLSPDKASPEKKSFFSWTPKNLDTFLCDHFVTIKEEVSPSGIADTLLSKDIIKDTDVEKIREEKYRVDKCDILIKAIARAAKVNDLNISKEVLGAFFSEGYDYLFTKKDSGRGKRLSKTQRKEIDGKEMKSRLYLNSKDLENELDPIVILDDLVPAGVLTLSEHEDINRTTFKPNKIQSIINYLLRKPTDVFWKFCDVLQKEYPVIANRLRDGSSSPSMSERKSAIKIEVSLTNSPSTTHSKDSESSETASSGTTEVKFTFCGDGREEEAMIVDEYNEGVNTGLQEEAMEDGFDIMSVHFSSIRIHLSSWSGSSQMEFVKKCQESPIFLKRWLQSIMKREHIQRLKEKHINTVSFVIKACIPKPEESCCHCLLSKETIVNHFSTLEKEMNNIDEMIGSFVRFEGFEDSDVRRSFECILEEKDTHSKMGMFLRKLLEMNQAGNVHICLMEREMRRTNPELFKRITKPSKEQFTKGNTINPKNIRQNMSLLLNELEPKQFKDMLRGIEGSEVVVEKVMSTDPRRERCREMINFIVKQGKPAVDMLVQELVRSKKTHILDILNVNDDEDDNTLLRAAFTKNYKIITEEIEPRVLRQVFVDRREILTKDIDGICKLPKRKERAVQLMKFIQNSKGSVQKCFLDAMELAGYKTLVRILKEDQESYKACPRIYASSFGDDRKITITGEFRLKFKKEISRKSPLQVLLKKSVWNETIDDMIGESLHDTNQWRPSTKEICTKSRRTREWIVEQQECIKRIRNDFDKNEDDVSNGKRFCVYPEKESDVSPSPSYLSFNSSRHDELGDTCSPSPSSYLTASRDDVSNGKRFCVYPEKESDVSSSPSYLSFNSSRHDELGDTCSPSPSSYLTASRGDVSNGKRFSVYPEKESDVSPSPSYLSFNSSRHDELGDTCSPSPSSYLTASRDDVSNGKRFCVYPEKESDVSPSPSYLCFNSSRHDELGDTCSPSPSSYRTASRGSYANTHYEDITPPSSPGGEDFDRPHTIFDAPLPLSMVFHRQDSNSSSGFLSQLASHVFCNETSKPTAAPLDCNSIPADSVTSNISRFTDRYCKWLVTGFKCLIEKCEMPNKPKS